MASSSCRISPIVPLFICSLVVSSLVCPAVSSESSGRGPANQTFLAGQELQKLRRIRERLKKINKPAVKTIKSVDGDLIDCVLIDQQPSFDHPQLRGQKPSDLPERPRGHEVGGLVEASFQLWHLSGESCPEGTIPIRRTSKEDMLRASSVARFGRKTMKDVRRDTTGSDHEHAVGYVSGDEYYGAKASINVWSPLVAYPYEFSLSQIWVISGSFGDDLNTIEAGWQVSPELYGDNYPRFFTYWTGLFRQIIELPLALQYPQLRLMVEDNLISAY